MIVLSVRDLTVQFAEHGRVTRVVDRLSYQLHAGRTLAIVGESGSGKTIGCRALIGLLPRSAQVSGSVLFGNEEILGLPEKRLRAYRGSKIGMIFQDPARALNPTLRIGHQVAEAVRQHQGVTGKAAVQRAAGLLERLRVPAQRMSAYPYELSGGMRQRVCIAIALSGRPGILIADEATKSLDAITQAETLRLLREIQRELGTAILMISHDMRLAMSFADEVLVMYAGRVAEHGQALGLGSRARMRYTRALLDAVPGLHRAPHSRFPVVNGTPAAPGGLPHACAYHPRCSHASDLCRTQVPALAQDAEHRWACWHPVGETAS